MSVLQAEKLCVSYNRIPALCNVNLSVEQGEYVCLLGNNGSGKSTLLKTAVGLNPVDSGSITINLAPDKVSYLPQQNPVEKGFPATVREVVMTGTQKPGKFTPFYTKEQKALCDAAMEQMGICEIANKRIANLSGGQQQRVMLARAICRQPSLLILDEPCAGLDVNISEQIYSILADLNSKGVTILMASHDMEEIGKYGSRFIVLNKSVEFDGNNREWHFYHHHRGCNHD